MAGATQSIGGLVSGLDTNSIIDSLMSIEKRPITIMENRIAEHQTKLAAYQGVNNLLLEFQSSVSSLAADSMWEVRNANSTNESILAATASSYADPGTHTFRVGRLAQTAQYMSSGFTDRSTTAVSPSGNGTIRLESAKARVTRSTDLASLNDGEGIYHGKLKITDRSGSSAVIDLSVAETMQDVLDAINSADGVKVQASVDSSGGSLVLKDISGGAGTLNVENYGNSTAAEDLGIAKSIAGGTLTGDSVYGLSNRTSLTTLRDALGVNDGTAGKIRIHDDAANFVNESSVLEDMLGGAGINSGYANLDNIKIIDGTKDFNVVLTSAETLGDVVQMINDTAEFYGSNVRASIDGNDRLVFEGGTAGAFEIQDTSGNTTAADLGIIGTDDGTGKITGSSLVTIPGGSFEVDLSDASTIRDVIDAVSAATDGNITAQISAGNSRALSLTGATGNISITNVGDDNTTAEDLGFYGSGAGTLQGKTILADMNSVQMASISGMKTFNSSLALADLNGGAGVAAGDFTITDRDGDSTTITLTGGETLGDLVKMINENADDVNVKAVIDAETGSLRLIDYSEGIDPFTVTEGSSTTATDLGIVAEIIGVGNITGTSVFTGGINGARGDLTQSLGKLRISDDGGSNWLDVDLSDLTGADSLSDVLSRLNAAAEAEYGTGALQFAVNDSGNGLKVINNTSGTTFTFDNLDGTAARDLGLTEVTSAAGSKSNVGDFDLNYISRATRLDSLNSNTGVYAGSIEVINSSGGSSTVDLSSADTIGDVIDAINKSTTSVKASLNSTGDGILLVDVLGGDSAITVKEVNGGSTASDLGLLGSGEGYLDGSLERVVKIDENDTLTDVMNKIADSGAALTVSAIYDGSEFTPYRLVVTSDNSGKAGDFIMESNIEAFNFQQNAKGQDSILLYGQAGQAVSPVMLKSASNTNNSAVLGLTLNLKEVSDTPVTVTVTEDTSEVETTIQAMVDAYNNIHDLIAEFDKWDEENEQPGILFADSATRSLMQTLSDMFFSTVKDVDGKTMMFYDIGVTFTDEGKLELDSSTLSTMINNNFAAVRELMTKTTDVARSDLNASVSSSGMGEVDSGGTPIANYKYSLDNLINGNTSSNEFGIANGYESAQAIESTGSSITINFDSPKTLTNLVLHHINSADMPAAEYALKDFKVEYFDTLAKSWETLRDVSGNKASATYMGFGTPTSVSSLRITAYSSNAADNKFRMVEIEAMEKQGLASSLETTVDSLADSIDGFFAVQEESLNDKIDDLQTAIDTKTEQLDSVELNYLKKFAAMESALAQMNSQSDYFTQQMDAISNQDN
jgi:flagellar hook-associated protein 2